MDNSGSPQAAVAAAGPNPSDNSPQGWARAVVVALRDVTMTLSGPLRAMIVFAFFGVLSFGIYMKFRNAIDDNGKPIQTSAEKDQPYVAREGVFDRTRRGADNTNPQNAEADHKSAEDNAAYRWHTNNGEDSPEELTIGDKNNPNEFLRYKYYAKSDKCLYVRRKIGNNEYDQWLQDPVYSQHAIDKSAVMNAKEMERLPEPSLFVWLLDQLSPRALASPPQASHCQNPHPGTFRYWWGKPFDGCRSPMYRQFQDGCTHYQVYNRCASSWENEINWTVCNNVSQHH